MNTRNDWFEDLQRNISDMIAKSPAGDIERNVRAMMTQTFSRLDLITREEFDIQKELLERLFERVTALELRIQALEGDGKAPESSGKAPATPSTAAPTSTASDPSSKSADTQPDNTP